MAQVSIAHNLELFRTRSCGWGVRCRNDLPSGAFVCCYFGDLMTEEHTEHMAKKHGDTYLAQLNFIESAEEYKEGYESHAHMSPSSLCIQSESDSDKAGERPPAKKARTSQVQSANETSSEVSSAGSSTSPNAQEMNEPPVTVINYFPRMETTNESHPTRQLFGRKETEYIIDGKRCGNIGRFFNVRILFCSSFHLCSLIPLVSLFNKFYRAFIAIDYVFISFHSNILYYIPCNFLASFSAFLRSEHVLAKCFHRHP